MVANFTCSVAMLMLLELDLFETDRHGSTVFACKVQTIVRESINFSSISAVLGENVGFWQLISHINLCSTVAPNSTK